MTTEQVRIADGRVLEVLLSGPADGFPLLLHHGTPQAAVPFPQMDSAAGDRGLRVVAYSRPGYGTSTPRPTGTVADDARDSAAVLDHLGAADFVTLGWSGGGPRALACAAVLPGRCRAAACGVGIVPAAEYPGDLRDGMGEANVAEYDAAFAGRSALEAHLSNAAPSLATATPSKLVAEMQSLLPAVDRDALAGELGDYLAASMRHALATGIDGWLDDDLTHIAAWGFDLAAISVPVSLWQGSEDKMVPVAHAEWLAAHIPGVDAHFVDGEGHLSLLRRMPGILDDLLAKAGLTR